MKPQPPKLNLTVMIMLLVFLAGTITVNYMEMQEVEAKKVVENKTVKLTHEQKLKQNLEKKYGKLSEIKTSGKYEPLLVLKNKKIIVSYGARDSCGCNKHYNRLGIKKFKNYCTGCHRWGTLKYESTRTVRWYTSPEGLWYCSRCDRDYCMGNGKENIRNSKYKLKVA